MKHNMMTHYNCLEEEISGSRLVNLLNELVNLHLSQETLQVFWTEGQFISLFFSEPMREVASTVTLNLLNCPMLVNYPEVTEGLDMTGLTVHNVLETGNVVKLCGKFLTTKSSTFTFTLDC